VRSVAILISVKTRAVLPDWQTARRSETPSER
jgi:hypothetical protein